MLGRRKAMDGQGNSADGPFRPNHRSGIGDTDLQLTAPITLKGGFGREGYATPGGAERSAGIVTREIDFFAQRLGQCSHMSWLKELPVCPRNIGAAASGYISWPGGLWLGE